MLDRKLKVKHAIMQRRIKIDGGVAAIQSAYKLVNVFLKPYLIDTWLEAENLR